MKSDFLSVLMTMDHPERRFRIALARLRNLGAAETGASPHESDLLAAALEEVEAAAYAVIAGPTRSPSDLEMKLAVLQDWYLADFWQPALSGDDGAGWALRRTFEDLRAWLPELEARRRAAKGPGGAEGADMEAVMDAAMNAAMNAAKGAAD